MIEQIVKDFLTARLGVPIKTEVPESPPGTFVVLERTDGEHSTGIKRCTLAVQSCAPTLLQAAQLDDRAIEAMEALAELDSVGACRLVRDYNFTDTESSGVPCAGADHYHQRVRCARAGHQQAG